MGEEFILFGAVTGVVLLLRRGEQANGVSEQTVGSDTIRLFGILMVGVALLVGLWLVAFGFVTPGGGFQGGVAIAGAIVLVFATVSYRAWRPFANELVLDPLEGAGVGAYVIVGLAALVSGPSCTTCSAPAGPGRSSPAAACPCSTGRPPWRSPRPRSSSSRSSSSTR